MKTKFILILSLLIMVTVLPGCLFSSNVSHSPFIGDFKRSSALQDFVYLKKGADLKSFDKIMVDHVILYLDENSGYKGLQTDELNNLAAAFHQAVYDQLKTDFVLTDHKGKGVLRIRPAVTGLKLSDPGLGDQTTLTSRKKSPGLRKIENFTQADLSGAKVEYEFIDGVTRERIAIGIDYLPKIEAQNLTSWQKATLIFKKWSKKLHARLKDRMKSHDESS